MPACCSQNKHPEKPCRRKVRDREMEEIIKQLLPLWGMQGGCLSQIYPCVWEISDSHVIKGYTDKKRLERNIKISKILGDYAIPAAQAVPTKAGESYAAHENTYFLLLNKLKGSSLCDMRDKTIAWKMGCAIARLHLALLQCEKEVLCWDNSLLKEMKGWIRENLTSNGWQLISEEDYFKTLARLESRYDTLPKQLIHRDVHPGNFLFFEGNLSGYIDFDLSQRNIRVFDLCYFLTGLLAQETESPLAEGEWLQTAKSVVAGYESIAKLSQEEKDALPCVMACIEILFMAYFIGLNDIKHAEDASQLFRFIQHCEKDIEGAIR